MSNDELRPDSAARGCPVCGTPPEAARVVYEERFDPARLDRFAFAARKVPEFMHWRLVECPVCNVLFASPAPSQQRVAAAYRDAAYDSAEEARYAAATYGQLLREFIPRVPHGRGLDVGAGDGAFMKVLLELGLEDVAGVEPSRAALADAEPEIRALIREGMFRAEDFEDEGFGVVSCLQTVEHLSDPLTTFREMHGLLQEGGVLFVVCHDRRAPLNRVLGRRSPIYDVEHLQLFGRRSLQVLLERAGFRDVDIQRFSNRYPLRYWLRLAPLRRRAKLRVIAALDRARLGSIPISLPAGNLAAVGWKAPAGNPAGGYRGEARYAGDTDGESSRR
jgi:SAM-dependent methyltransferase